MNSDDHTQNQALLAALFKGRAIFEKMEGRWPDDFEAIKRSEPLWKTDLAFISQGWADFAAHSFGWLDQSASSLVSSSKVLADRPISQYNEIASRLDKLHEEVARPPSGKSLSDNWHILRRPVQQSPAERLEKIIEDKKALDQASGSRLHRLRDAIEMRDLSREMLAILHQNVKVLDEVGAEKVEAGRLDIENDFGSDPLMPMVQQQHERLNRLHRRAQSALSVVQERITHEFSNHTSDVSDLDEAINQEALMHSRIESMTGKVASLIAGRSLGHVSKEQSVHMQLIAALPEVAQEKAISVPTQSGFLGRFLRRQDKSGISKESKKVFTELRRVFEETGYALTLSEIREKHSQEYFWKLISELMKDPEVSALEPIKGSPLLCFMMDKLNEIEKDEEPELFTKALCITYMMAESGKDSKGALKKTRPYLLRSILKKSLALEDYDTPGASRQEEALWGLSLVSRSLNRENENADIANVLAKFLQENQVVSLPKPTLDILVSMSADLLLPGKQVSNLNSRLDLVDKLSNHLPFETVSYQYFNYFQQKMFSGDSKNLSRHAVDTLLLSQERMDFLNIDQIDELAEAVLRQRGSRIENWGAVLLSKSRHLLTQSDTQEKTALGHFENLKILNEYFMMMQSPHPLNAWPKEITRFAFVKKDMDLLNELAKYQPDARIPELLGQRYEKMLIDVISSDCQASLRNKGAPQTDASFWIERLSSPDSHKGPSIPETTPLMVAFGWGSAHWIKALLNAGADLDAVDKNGMSAHDHWLEGLWKKCEKSSEGHDKSKIRNTGLRILVDEVKAINLFVRRAYEQCELFDQWAYFEKIGAPGCPPKKILTYAIEQECLLPADQNVNKSRMDALTRSVKDQGQEFFFETAKFILSKKDSMASASKEVETLVKIGACAGFFDPVNNDFAEKMFQQIEKSKEEQRAIKERKAEMEKNEIDFQLKKMKNFSKNYDNMSAEMTRFMNNSIDAKIKSRPGRKF